MSLPLPDRSLQTNCKNCIFAIYDSNTQIECGAGRIQKFKKSNRVIEAYDNEKEFYVIKGLCNLNRPLSWNNGIPDNNKAIEESSVDYKIYFDCTDLTTQFKNKILQFVNNDYYSTKYNITLYHTLNVSQNIKKDVIDIYKSSNRKIYITSCRDVDQYIHNAYINAKEAYSINIKNSDDFDTDILSKLNDKINIDLKSSLLIKNKTIYIVSNTVYRIEDMENRYNNFSQTLDSLISKIQNTDLYFEI